MILKIDSTSPGAELFSNSRRRMQALNQAAAGYFGISMKELRRELESGYSLSDIATDKGKSVEGLRQALLAADPGTPGNAGINPTAFVDRILNHHRNEDNPGQHQGHHGQGASVRDGGDGVVGPGGAPVTTPRPGPIVIDPVPPGLVKDSPYHVHGGKGAV